MVFLGIYPSPFLSRVQPSVSHLLAHVQAADPSLHIPVSGRSKLTYAVPDSQRVDALPLGRAASAVGAPSGGGR
jgi:hypothetical protein